MLILMCNICCSIESIAQPWTLLNLKCTILHSTIFIPLKMLYNIGYTIDVEIYMNLNIVCNTVRKIVHITTQY